MVSDPQRVRHRCERGIHRADAREDARVDDVQVVEFVRLAIRIDHRRGRVVAHPAGSGLVRDARRGRERVFALEPKRLEKARQYLDHVAAQWDAAAARLKAFVEK